MPGGGPPTPTRPHKLISFSAERVRYSCGGGVEGFIFGLVFSSMGAFCLVLAGWFLLCLVGVPLPQQTGSEPSLLGILAPALMLFAIGSGFSLAGFGFFCTFRTTLDRQRDEVVVRSGWLGCRRRRSRLSEFREVVVLPSDQASVREGQYTSTFDVALSDGNEKILSVGQVTLSFELARKLAKEVSDFTNLPVA